MNEDNEPQPISTGRNPETCQVNDKPPHRVRIRSGEGTLAYWRSRLFRNSYQDKTGSTVEIPEFYVRLRHAGVTKRVRMHTSDKEKAAEEALGLSGRLLREGWGAVDAGRARLPASPTIGEFCEAYEKAAASMESPPRPISVLTYVRSLRQVCSLAGVSRLRELDRDAIDRSREAYRAKGKAAQRADSAIQNTWAKLVRNSAACFSTEARAILAKRGLPQRQLDRPTTTIKTPRS